MGRGWRLRAALAALGIAAALGAGAGSAHGASSSPFACDQPAAAGGVALRVAIPADAPASIPVPRDCFPAGAAIALDAPEAGSAQTGAGGAVAGRYVAYRPAPGARGVVTLRFRAGGEERRVAVDVGGADAGRPVVAIGDSVTAAFGYCGAGDACAPRDAAIKDSWLSLKDCDQEAEYPRLPQNLCSNNRGDGLPWERGGETGGTVAYPFQFGAWLQDATARAGLGPAPTVRNWAVSGARPAHWDPVAMPGDPTNRDRPGGFSRQTTAIRDSLVVMTLGANRLLADFLQFDFAYPFGWFADITGPYARCTGTRGWFGSYDEADRARLRRCFEEDWAANRQTEHLVNVYRQLLAQGNRVLVVGYHLACPSTFGTWQQMSFFGGPSATTPCPRMRGDHGLTQWDQAAYVSSLLGDRVRDAVEQARAWARATWPGTGRDRWIAYLDVAALDPWADHQAWAREPWVFPYDTGIHPSRRGHAVMAEKVADAACGLLALFCAQHAALAPATYDFPGLRGDPIRSATRVVGPTARAAAGTRPVPARAVVARVGRTAITAGQVRRMARALHDEARHPADDGAEEALKTLITGVQVRAEARRLGIRPPHGPALDRAVRRFGVHAPRALRREARWVTVSAFLAQRVAERLVGRPRYPTAAEGRAYARRHWGGARSRTAVDAARAALYRERTTAARERAQRLVHARYARVTRCTRHARGNRACTTPHGAWAW